MAAFIVCWLFGSALGFWLLVNCALREFGKVTLGDALVFVIVSVGGSLLPGLVYWFILHRSRDGKEMVLWRRR